MRAQSERFGTEIISETISRVDLSAQPFKYWTEYNEEEPPESFSARYRSASRAAIHPDPVCTVNSYSGKGRVDSGCDSPALVMACRYLLSCTSPAANTPSMLV